MLANAYNVGSVNQCHIVSEVMDNVSDHLPVGMELRVELCKVKTGKWPVTTGMPSYPPANWTNDARNEQYRNIVREKLMCIPPLTLDSKNDAKMAENCINDYVTSLNSALHDAAAEVGCTSTHHYNPKLSVLRDRKRFWWSL